MSENILLGVSRRLIERMHAQDETAPDLIEDDDRFTVSALQGCSALTVSDRTP